MAATKFLKLIAIKDKEPNLTWEELCSNPLDLFNKFTEYFGVESIQDLPPIIISPNTPTAQDRGKLWLKTSDPWGLGYMIDGVYRFAYMNGFPTNIPFLYSPSDLPVNPAGVRQLSSDEITDFGMTDTVASAGPLRKRWYIFEPDDIPV